MNHQSHIITKHFYYILRNYTLGAIKNHDNAGNLLCMFCYDRRARSTADFKLSCKSWLAMHGRDRALNQRRIREHVMATNALATVTWASEEDDSIFATTESMDAQIARVKNGIRLDHQAEMLTSIHLWRGWRVASDTIARPRR